MTTTHHPAADWKLTETRRLLTAFGWATLLLAAAGVVAAVALGTPGAWWVAAGTASVALCVSALLPSPVPADLLTDRRRRVDSRVPSPPPR